MANVCPIMNGGPCRGDQCMLWLGAAKEGTGGPVRGVFNIMAFSMDVVGSSRGLCAFKAMGLGGMRLIIGDLGSTKA
jgi:hypothetical protein